MITKKEVRSPEEVVVAIVVAVVIEVPIVVAVVVTITSHMAKQIIILLKGR